MNASTISPFEGTPKQPLRNLILDTARKLFAEQGYAKVSMRFLAKRIGYSPTTIYHHFRDKKELFLCLTEEIYRDFLKVTNEIIDREQNPRVALKKILYTFVDMGVRNPNAYRIGFMMETDIRPNHEAHFSGNPLGRTMYERINDCVCKCMKHPENQDQVTLSAHAVVAASHGLTALFVAYPNFNWGPIDKLKQKVIDPAVDAIE
ncbi:TetR/AcrR family transcriptional regulator [Maridesulfovibrio bastinii]|jgi:AcrR family transcriptional regulator|uniref:TetR/AcrR family transcriptional regulator n=1 Tax=Maridesulfovibrio bastinii TaxID=47157 RepID=UPI00040A0287|nr:TetR/AcrR family transcriptional regulator [Maridesulfovibrio bastinii]